MIHCLHWESSASSRSATPERDGRGETHDRTHLWEPEEAIRRFAGDDPDRAVFYPEDERFLVDRGERVDHFEVVFEDGLSPR